MRGKNLLIVLLCFLFVVAIWGCQPKETPDAGNGNAADAENGDDTKNADTDVGGPAASGPGTEIPADKSPGEQYFAEVCVACHSIPGTEYEKERGEPLVGIGEKYDEDSLKEMLGDHLDDAEIPPEIMADLVAFLLAI